MRIICPTCASHYEVDVARIAAPGQLVRCARCRDVWLVRPPHQQGSRSLSVPPTIDDPTADSRAAGDMAAEVIDFRAARGRLRPRQPWASGRARATSLTVLALGLAALSAASSLAPVRTAIAARFPLAARIYAAVGLPSADKALSLRDVRGVLVAEGDETVLTLQGKIANTGSTPAPVPNLTVVVRGEDRVPLYTWTAAAPKPVLAKGETIDFRSRLASPPEGGRDVRISFADRAPSPTGLSNP